MSTESRPPHEVVSLTVGNVSQNNWTSYSIDSDLLTPADGWLVSMGLPRGEIPGHILPGALVTVAMGDETILVGRIDEVHKHSVKGRRSISLSGRDLGGTLQDCSAPVFMQLASSPRELVSRIVAPLGISKVLVQSGGLRHDKFSVDPGMTAWQAVARLCELNDCHAWMAPDGTLVIGRPDYSAPPSATLRLDVENNANVLSLGIRQSLHGVHSEVSVLAQTHGNDTRLSTPGIKISEKNDLFSAQGTHRPLILVDGAADSLEHSRKKARKAIADANFNALTIQAEVRGHRTEEGILWEPGQRVRVVSTPDGIDGTFFLTQRTFRCETNGQSTALTLKPDGIWMTGA